MKDNNVRYNVIWIDDEWEKYDDLTVFASGRGIDIRPFKYGKAGIKALTGNINAWDGVILDVKCLYDENDGSAAGANFYKVRDELIAVKSQKRNDIPIFVYSAQPDYYGNKVFLESLNGQKFYQKGADDEALVNDIKTEAEKLPETQIRHKYLSFIRDDRFQEIEPELITILTAVENDETNDPGVIRDCRPVLDWVMNYLQGVGVLQRNFKGSNLSECSAFLGHKKMSKFVPIHIQRSLHSCVAVSNDGSHRFTEVFSAVNDGETPFLIRSTVFELLNILSWCATLSTKPEDVEKMKADVAHLEISMKFIAEGELQKDEHGNYHCGDYLVTYKQVENYGLKEGDILRIGKSQKNVSRSDSKPYEEMAIDGTIEKV